MTQETGETMLQSRDRATAGPRDRVVLNLPELDQCVHCGLCLNHCPTYRVTHLEPESPRGRIHLVRAVAEGRIEALDPARGTPNERFAEHIYLCLMCRACETACPSGVQFGRIAEAAREVLGPPGSPLARRLARLAFTQVFPFPRRLRWLASALRLYQRSGLQRVIRLMLPRRLREMEALLPTVPSRFFAHDADPLPAIGPRRARGALLSGCVMSTLFGEVNDASVRVLRRNGCDVVVPRGQVCCGALNVHNGETTAAIPGLHLVEMEGADPCCGSAGIYNITHPEMSKELLTEKMAAVGRTGAEAVVAPNPGCMLQLRFGAQRYGPALPVFHLMDLLDRAYEPRSESPHSAVRSRQSGSRSSVGPSSQSS